MSEAVYFVEAPNGLVKIGRASSVPKRLRELRAMSPVQLYLLHAIPCPDGAALKMERHLHEHFAEKRHHGEWFKLSKRDKKDIVTLLDQHAEVELDKDEMLACRDCLRYVKGKRGLISHRRFCKGE